MDDPETLVVRVVPDGGGAAEDTLRAPPSAAPDGRGVLDDASASRSRRQTSRRRSLRAGSNSLGATPSHRDRASSFVLEADDAGDADGSGGDRARGSWARGRLAVVRALDTAATRVFLFLVLLLALFLTDVVAFVSAPDVVNPAVAWTMFACLVVFAMEFALNCVCRDGYVNSFFFWMDLLGTFSIVADVSWLSDGWLPDGAEIGTTLRVSRAAKIGARVSRDWAAATRLAKTLPTLRLIRAVRGVRLSESTLEESARRARRDGAKGVDRSTSKIAASLNESMSKNIAVVVLLTILAAPMLLWNDSDTIPAAYHQSLRAVSDSAAVVPLDGGGGDGSPSFAEGVSDAVAEGFYDFFAASERKPVALRFGGRAWDWTSEFPRSRRGADRLELASPSCGDAVFHDTGDGVPSEVSSSCVWLELDISPVNRWTAFLNIGMVVFVIVELVLVSALLARVTNRLVVDPLERMFGKIKTNMRTIVGAFGANADSSRDDDDENGGGMGAMEAAIEKMARLVKHVAGSGAQGARAFDEYVNDANVDEKTRAWLVDNYGGENKTPKKLTPLKPSASLGASLRRPSSAASPAPTNKSSPAHSRRGSESVVKLDGPGKDPGSPAEPRGTRPALAPSSLLRAFDASAGKDAPGSTAKPRDERRRSLLSSRNSSRGGSGASVASDRYSADKKPPGGGRESSEGFESKTRERIRDGSRGSSRSVARSPSFDVERGVGREAADADEIASSDASSSPSSYASEEEDEDSGVPLRAGPELRSLQAKARSRFRAKGAQRAVRAARDAGIALPHPLDLSLIDTWDFDALALTSEESRAYVLCMFGALGLLRTSDDAEDAEGERGERSGGAPFEAFTFSDPPPASLDAEAASSDGFCSPARLWRFLARVEGGYNKNPYHNFQHAVDVTHTVYRYVVLTEPRTHVTQVEKFALMIAALAHDLDHPGVSNAFLVNTKDELATVYNDSSVLENAHVARLYTIVNTRQVTKGSASARDDGALSSVDEANVFSGLDEDLYREVRKIIIAAVLHTDMSHHFKMVSQMEVFCELHSASIAANTRRVERGLLVECVYDTPEDRLFVLRVILHAADVGNPVKPLKTYAKWADRVLREFFAQGEKEKSLGIPVSPMMDRGATNVAMSQINFIEFVVAPLYASFVRLFPETAELVGNLVGNRMHYQAVLESELRDPSSPPPPEDEVEEDDASASPSRGVRAGVGKSAKERREEMAATRARFAALVEKHEFATGPARGFLEHAPAFRVLFTDRDRSRALTTALTRSFFER